MKKTLIALAALAASSAALAQSNVTLYGIVDTGVGYIKGDKTVYGLTRNGVNVSRVGFRGVEDLGNGLKATFKLEAGLFSDTGVPGGAGNTSGGLAFTRESTVGLQGSFGAVRLGRELVESYNATSRFDPFGTSGVGGSLLWQKQVTRVDNGVEYQSPNFNGFRVGVNLGFGEKTESRNSRYVGVGVTYDQGPISIGLGVDRANDRKDATAAAAATAATGDQTSFHLGASYDFGMAKVSFAYLNDKFKPVAGGKSDKTRAFLLGVSAPVGAAGEVKFSYNNYRFKEPATTAQKANQFSLGYQHNLSKRTAVYTAYSMIRNKDGGKWTLGLDGLDLPKGARLKDGKKQQGLEVGIRHMF